MDTYSGYDYFTNYGSVDMKAVRTKTANRTYTAKGCEPLPATAIQFADGKVVTEACFELDAAELEQVSKSGKIYITFVGDRVIPFMLHTESNAAVQDECKSSRWVQDEKNHLEPL